MAPTVFLEIKRGDEYLGRIIIELFGEYYPRTCENFRQLCTGEWRRDGQPVGYKDTHFHRVESASHMVGGDFVYDDGRGSSSIYGEYFEPEMVRGGRRPVEGHGEAGLLGMWPNSQGRLGCQFYLTVGDRSRELNSIGYVIGRVTQGMQILRLMQEVPLLGSIPKVAITICDCGEM